MPNPLRISASPIPYVLLSGQCSLSFLSCREFSIPYSFRGITQKSYFNSYAGHSLVTRYSSLIPYHLSLFVLLFDFKKQSRPRLPAGTRHFRASCVLSGHPDMGGRGFIDRPSKIFNSCIRFYILTNKTNTSPHICCSIREFGLNDPQIWGSFVSCSFFFQKRIPSTRLNHSTTPLKSRELSGSDHSAIGRFDQTPACPWRFPKGTVPQPVPIPLFLVPYYSSPNHYQTIRLFDSSPIRLFDSSTI